MKSKYYILLAQLIIIFSAVVVMAGELEETFDKSYPLQPGQHFYLRNVNGKVQIYGWDREEVRIMAVKRVRAGNRRYAEQVLNEIDIRIDQDDEGIRVETYIPKSTSRGFLSWLFDGFGSHDISVRYEIWLPEDVYAEIRTVNGSIYAEKIRGELELRTTNGKIRVENVGGRLTARTTNGSVAVELVDVDPDADIRVRTTNGSVRVWLPEDFAGILEAKTTNGSISTDFPVEVSGKITRRSLRGRVGDGTARCSVSTTNGSVKILKIEK